MIDSLIKRLRGELSQRRFASLSDTVMYERLMFAVKARMKTCEMASEEKVDKENDVALLPAGFSLLDFGISELKHIWLL